MVKLTLIALMPVLREREHIFSVDAELPGEYAIDCSLKLDDLFNPAGDHGAEFGPRDQCKSCAGRNSAGFGMTL